MDLEDKERADKEDQGPSSVGHLRSHAPIGKSSPASESQPWSRQGPRVSPIIRSPR